MAVKQRMWTKEEENIILDFGNKEINLYELSSTLDRTIGSVCKKVYKLTGKDLRNQIIGSRRRAVNHYKLMLRRCNSNNKKDKGYKNISVLVSKDDFIEWFMPKDFKGCSVDRIDNTKDYTFDNMQVISIKENIAKDKVKAKDGFCECFVCKEVKPIELFAVDKRRQNGHTTICKSCDNKRRKRGKM